MSSDLIPTFKPLPPLTERAAKNIVLSGTRQSPLAKEARDNFAVFYQYVFGKEILPHHWKIIDALATYKSNEQLKYVAGPHTNILMPRGAAKSTVGKHWLAWVIGNNPHIKIILISYNEQTAMGFSRFVRDMIKENELYQEVFPEIIPGAYWNERQWQIDVKYATGKFPEVDYTVFATGIQGGIASKRSDIIYVDDVIKNSEDISNPDTREKRRNNWYQAILPTLYRKTGRIIDLGTRYHPQDEHATLFTPKQGFNVIRQKAIIVDDKGCEISYWEDQHPIRKLIEERAKDPVAFAYQYQNEAIVKTSDSFNPAWIRRCDILPIDRYQVLTIGVDLASTLGTKSDYTVFMLCGTTPDGDYHVIDYIRGKWMGNTEKIEILKELLYEYGIIDTTKSLGKEIYVGTDIICNMVIETVAYQHSFRGDFRKVFYEDNELYNVVDVPIKAPRTSKGHRFLGITGAFESGKVYFNEYRNMGALIDELIGFGTGDHDDMVDALVYALKFLFKRKPISITYI